VLNASGSADTLTNLDVQLGRRGVQPGRRARPRLRHPTASHGSPRAGGL